MDSPVAVPSHVDITETMLRLYVFLANYLDRCIDESARQTYPEPDLQAHLAETAAKLSEILAINRVVKQKVEQECDRMLALGSACLSGQGSALKDDVKSARTALQQKMIALSDLLAVFRSV